MLRSITDPSVQYDWPPQDPSRLPNPPPPSATASAFVYGNDGFNPALRPTSSVMRARHLSNKGDKMAHELESSEDEGASSSPERYLSDYDDEGLGPADYEADQRRRLGSRVRRGSEGWEVQPAASWGAGLDDVERGVVRPWEDPGRYQMYEPEVDDGQDSDGWGDGEIAVEPTQADADDTKYSIMP